MGRRKIIGRSVARETLLAVLVLALTFLNFGQVAVSASGQTQFVADSWCGDPMVPDAVDHSPCHACRIGGGADLPREPSCIGPVAFGTAPVAYVTVDLALDRTRLLLAASPRGPPTA